MNSPRAFTLVLTLALLAGCATTGTKEAADPKEKKVEYVYYTPTGSNIAVRIRKDLLQTPDSTTNNDQAVLRDLQIKGQRAPKGD